MDVAILAVVVAIGVFIRFYALNRVLDSFEGELSPFAAGATDLRGMLHANAGRNGPWAPLGYLYYLPIFVTTKLFGVNVLSLRLASAIPSALTIALLYGFVRRIAGRAAAAAAAVLVALDPLQIGWGRSDVHPHGSTVQIAILLAWATHAAAESGRGRDFALVALLMGVSVHQYPSGQVAVLMPLGFFAWRWLSGAPLALGRATLSSLLGIGLWLFGLPLPHLLVTGHWQIPNLFTIFGARTSWAGADGDAHAVLGQVATRSFQNLSDLVQGIFVGVPRLFHQEWMPEYPDLTVRSVVWLAVPFAAVTAVRALMRRADGVTLVFVWAAVGLLPSVLSAEAFPKRAAIAYPAVLALAGIGLATASHELVRRFGPKMRTAIAIVSFLGIAAYVLATGRLWFAGDRYP